MTRTEQALIRFIENQITSSLSNLLVLAEGIREEGGDCPLSDHYVLAHIIRGYRVHNMQYAAVCPFCGLKV